MMFCWGIVCVAPAPDHADVQLVGLECGCLGVWARGAHVGYSLMCYAHECFKLLARVQLSVN